jgi:hypothetical protein
LCLTGNRPTEAMLHPAIQFCEWNASAAHQPYVIAPTKKNDLAVGHNYSSRIGKRFTIKVFLFAI